MRHYSPPRHSYEPRTTAAEAEAEFLARVRKRLVERNAFGSLGIQVLADAQQLTFDDDADERTAA